jgi:hypothetical protein
MTLSLKSATRSSLGARRNRNRHGVWSTVESRGRAFPWSVGFKGIKRRHTSRRRRRPGRLVKGGAATRTLLPWVRPRVRLLIRQRAHPTLVTAAVLLGMGVTLTKCAEGRADSAPVVSSGSESGPVRRPPCDFQGCTRCDLEAVVRQRAPEGATACGWARRRSEREAVVRCALEADAAGHPYWAIERLQGADSAIVGAWVRGADGKVEQFWYDSDGSGANCRCRATITLRPCPSSLARHEASPDRLTCGTDQDTPMEWLCSEESPPDAGEAH